MMDAGKIIFCSLLLAIGTVASAQVDRHEVRSGNRSFKKGSVRQAEIAYRKAVVKDSTSVAGQYDLASALYRQQDWDGAGKALDAVKEQASASPHAADYWYNVGDVAIQKKDWQTAVDAYRKSLVLNPGDIDAKENYIYAKKMLENQKNGGGGGGSDNQNQDQNQNNDQNQDQNQNQNQNQDQDKDQNQNQDQQSQQPNVSQQQAQQMLKAIQAQEKKTQDKVNKEKAEALQSRQKEKNW